MKALVENGVFNQETKKRMQKWLGVKQDGKIGGKTKKALQKRVGAKQDGKWGRGTTKKLQTYLNKHGNAGLKVDGGFGKKTKKALQRFLNAYYKLKPEPAPTPTPTPTPSTKGEKIAAKAKEFAYAYGTSKKTYAYPKGKPKAAYKAGLKQAYGSRKGWGKQTKAGASCDVFAGTVIRCAGIDSKFPRGLDEQIPHLKKSSKFKQIKPKKMADLKPGDIVVWKKSSGTKHICIYIGGNKVCEAGYKSKRYGCTTKKSNDYFLKPSKYKMLRIYRAS